VTPGYRADRGSASVWVLACSALVLLIGVATSMRTAAVLARHRAESAADFAALAAAGRIGVGGDSCAAAAALAAANGAALVRCRTNLGPDGRTGIVDVSISLAVRLPVLGTERVVATARAGRLDEELVRTERAGRPGEERVRGRSGRPDGEPVSAAARAGRPANAAGDGTARCLATRAPPRGPGEAVIAHAR
jgi:secretion/DNA translocation related TadE-like protein